MKRTNSPAFQILEMYTEDYNTYNKGHQVFKDLYEKALADYEYTKKRVDEKSKDILVKRLESQRKELDRLQTLKATMWELVKTSMKNYSDEHDRLTALGIEL